MADGKLSVEELIKVLEEQKTNPKLLEAMKKFSGGKASLDVTFDSADPERIRQIAEGMRLQADFLGQINDKQALRQQLSSELLEIEKQIQILSLNDDNKEAVEELEKAQRQMVAQAKELGFAVDKNNKKIVEMSPAAKKAQEAFTPFMSSLARKMGMVGKTQDTMTSKIMSGLTNLQSQDGLKGVLESFTSVFSVINVAESIVLKFVESTMKMVKEFDKASSSFAAATGAGNAFSGALLQAQKQGNILGVTFDNAGNSIKGLFEGFVGFVDMSESAQAALVQDVALFERIGVNAQTSAKMLTTFTRNLDMSANGALNMTKALSQMGDQIGVSAQKMMSDFESAFKSLAVYGDQSIEVFQGLAAAAKAAGVEVSTLTSIAGKFDTFSGAAESVGKLNALLGSQISSTEMLMMTEDQRIETLIQQVQVSGTNFKDMNKFQQMAIANAAGIQDMAEAQRIFGMSFNEYGKYKDRMQAQNNVQDNFNKAIEATLPLTEKFSIFMKEFAVAVEKVHFIFEFFMDALLGFAKIGDGALLRFTGIASALILTKKILGTILPLKKTFTFLTGKMAKLLKLENLQRLFGNKVKQEQAVTDEVVSGTQTQLSVTSQAAAKGLMQMAFGFAAIAAGIGVAAAGLGYFVESFKDLEGAQLGVAGVALVGLAIGFAVLIKSLAAMTATGAATLGAAALVQLGVGVLAIGAGVGVAAVGLGFMASSVAELADKGMTAVAVLGSLASVMVAMAASSRASGFGFFGASSVLEAVKSDLEEIGKLLNGDEVLQNGLENVALMVSGRSAKVTTEGTTEAIAQLKTAFSGLMEQKVTISLNIKDGALSKMVEDVVINGLTAGQTNGIYRATIKAVGAVGE